MARTARISDDEILRARKLRDEAITADELREALSVLMMALPVHVPIGKFPQVEGQKLTKTKKTSRPNDFLLLDGVM